MKRPLLLAASWPLEMLLYEQGIHTDWRAARWKGLSLKRLGNFDLRLEKSFGFSGRRIPVQILVDQESTIVLLDCRCCEELLANKLPGGVLIPIATALKIYFEGRGMRNVDVSMNGTLMRRTYAGVADETIVPEMRSQLKEAVSRFNKRKKPR
ncbi:MAG: hypothetical protein ACXADS_04160 [Candidatus Thorarchaeota archaeon]|jgi:hypothetical protein